MGTVLNFLLKYRLVYIAYIMFALFSPIWFVINFLFVMYNEFLLGIFRTFIEQFKYIYTENKRINKEK